MCCIAVVPPKLRTSVQRPSIYSGLLLCAACNELFTGGSMAGSRTEARIRPNAHTDCILAYGRYVCGHARWKSRLERGAPIVEGASSFFPCRTPHAGPGTESLVCRVYACRCPCCAACRCWRSGSDESRGCSSCAHVSLQQFVRYSWYRQRRYVSIPWRRCCCSCCSGQRLARCAKAG